MLDEYSVERCHPSNFSHNVSRSRRGRDLIAIALVAFASDYKHSQWRKASEQVKWRSVICFYFDGYHFTGFWATPSNHHPAWKPPSSVFLSVSPLLPSSSILFESIPSSFLSLSLSLFLNSLWRKLLICFIANGGCPGETWGKGFLVPHSGSDGLQTTPVLTVVGNMCNGIPCRTSTYTYTRTTVRYVGVSKSPVWECVTPYVLATPFFQEIFSSERLHLAHDHDFHRFARCINYNPHPKARGKTLSSPGVGNTDASSIAFFHLLLREWIISLSLSLRILMQITTTICLWGVGGWIINWFSIEWYYSSNLLEEFSKHEEEEEKWSFYSYIAGTTIFVPRKSNN